MTSAPATSVSKPQPSSVLMPPRAWMWIGILAVLFATLFRDWLIRMLRIATNASGTSLLEVLGDVMGQSWNPDWSHALVIPFISLYYIHLHRHDLTTLRADQSWKPFERGVQWGALLVMGLWGLQNSGLIPARVAGVMAFALRGPLMGGSVLIAALGPLVFTLLWRHVLKAVGLRIEMATWMRLLGLLILLIGIANYIYWIYPGRNDMLQGYSVILSLLGLLLLVLGPARMKVLWFPTLFLVFSVKIADRQWEQIAWQLQWTASRAAAFILNLTGIDATVTGSTIELYQGVKELGKLNVAEACAGLRMLMAFMSLGVAMAFLFDRAWWQRAIMVLMTVPIAMLVNIGRVTTLGLLYPINPKLASGDFHTFIGLVMLIPAALLFLLLGWVLDKLVIYDDNDRAGPASAAQLPAATPQTLSISRVWSGLVVGVTVMLTLGLGYAMVVMWSRPDLVPWGMSRGVMGALGGAASLALLVVAAALVMKTATNRLASGLTLGVAAGVLLTSTAGLYAVVSSNDLVFNKLAVPLRKKLYSVPEKIKGWEMVGKEEILTAELEQELGTTDYISRTYKDMTLGDGDAAAVARVHIAYYTGTPDTVPHVPDRCYVAGGVQPIGTNEVTLNVGGAGYMTDDDGRVTALSSLARDNVRIPTDRIPATRFTFAPAGDPDRASNVIYFFAANGKFLVSPEAVRAQAFGLRDKYSYYCKIEVGFFGEPDPDEAAKRTSALLSAVLPEIMACLPDWVDVTEGRYPPKE